MGPFLSGFADELIKLATIAQPGGQEGLSNGVTSSFKNTFKSPSMDTKKGPSATPLAPKEQKPAPVTSPTMMTDYRGGYGS